MDQKKGGIHVGHALMGTTGACPGFSVQPNESVESFGAAVRERLTPAAIEQVRMLYSDAPSEKMLEHLPRCLGVAQDRLHVALRAEQCTDGKRTACSFEVLQLTRKFSRPLGVPEENLAREIYDGLPMPA
eukprot:9323071-Pyramimonas_sp.AAC.1